MDIFGEPLFYYRKTTKIALEGNCVPHFASWESPSGNYLPPHGPGIQPDCLNLRFIPARQGDAKLQDKCSASSQQASFAQRHGEKKHYFYLKINIDMLLEG